MCWGAKKHQSGFTLIEIVMTLVITGFIGVGITYGLIYGVSLYRGVVGIEQVMPQADVAMNVISQQIRKDPTQKARFRFEASTGSLLMDEKVLLKHVEAFSITKVPTVFNRGELYQVKLTLEPGAGGAKAKTFDFKIFAKE